MQMETDPSMSDLVERLNEKLKLKYIGNCKCGKCQLVEADLIAEAVSDLTRLRSEVERLTRERDDAQKQYADLVQMERKAGENIAIGCEIELAEERAKLTTLTARTRKVLAAIIHVADDGAEQADRAFKGFTALNAAAFMHGRASKVAADIRATANTLFNELKEKDNG